MIEFLDSMSVLILLLSIIIFIITFLISLPNMLDSEKKYFKYEYNAVTNNIYLDHHFSFMICKVSDCYRCYIERTPPFRGRNTSDYMPHYLTDKGRKYICWTGAIKTLEQARILCRNWSDATQKFIDTGNPAPGFER